MSYLVLAYTVVIVRDDRLSSIFIQFNNVFGV